VSVRIRAVDRPQRIRREIAAQGWGVIPHQVVVGPRFGVCVLTGQAQVQLETATVANGGLLNMCDAGRFVLRTPYDRTSLVDDGDRRAPMIEIGRASCRERGEMSAVAGSGCEKRW